MARNKTTIKLTPEDEKKIIHKLSRLQTLPPNRKHKNKKAYSRRKKFKKQNIW